MEYMKYKFRGMIDETMAEVNIGSHANPRTKYFKYLGSII